MSELWLFAVSAGISTGYDFIGRDALVDHRGPGDNLTKVYDVTIQKVS